jgi:hypothetical protein
MGACHHLFLAVTIYFVITPDIAGRAVAGPRDAVEAVILDIDRATAQRLAMQIAEQVIAEGADAPGTAGADQAIERIIALGAVL